ncbi:MAG: ABC transporter permease [Actinobacteria bacterium]|nr:ABC transporter permease [Actinomycetota bacterium]
MSTVVQPVPRSFGRTIGRRFRDWLPALVVFVLVLVAWQGLVEVFNIRQFLLPKPTAILGALRDNRSDLWSAGIVTFKEALGGFAMGSTAAILVALVLARWRRVGGAIMPYAIAANAVPIIAFAPITNNWFGLLNPMSKMVIAAVLCFFPVFVNTLRGLTSVEPASIELMRSYAAGEIETFRRVRIPNALPFIFTGLKVASVLAMIGAVVGEYFGGPLDALGVVIQNNVALFDFPLAWAGIIVASAFGIAFYAAVAVAEHFLTGWQPAADSRSD